MTEDELRARLRAAAADHHPDRTVMLNRIAQNRTTGRRPRGQAVRLAGAALAVATVLGLGGVARWALAGEDHPEVTAPVATASPAPSTTPPKTITKAPSAPVKTGQSGAEQGPLWSAGSVEPASTDTLGLSDVTLRVRAPITALDVTIRVALTPGLADQGALHDVRTAQIDSTVLHETDALIYHFKLSKGATLAKGTYVFTAKYAHAAGRRNARGDTYRAEATAGGDKLDVHGDFYRTN